MIAITFDTLKFVERLITAGVPETQAKVEAFALRDVLAESLDTTLATKANITDLKFSITELKYDLLKWIVGLAIVQFSLLIGVLIKLSH
ncbi:DUF1640 domain-containing protein [Gammaproteobacteria bacterium]